MKVLLAPDSFKGSLSSEEVIKVIRSEMSLRLEGVLFDELPIADGGEGTIDALIHGNDGHIGHCLALDPLGRQIEVPYGILGDRGIVEMAAVSGLTKMSVDERDPLNASSYGTGQVIKELLGKGFRQIVIGIGGSGTNDGGTGAMEALGVRFYDDEHQLLSPMCGRKLGAIAAIDVTGLDQGIKETQIQVMCDVTNPLTGPDGATYVYGPQKGADEASLELLEAGMLNYREQLKTLDHRDYGALPGAGAAGGIGAALVAFLGGELVSGIGQVLSLARYEDRLRGCDLVITGEGRVDGQSASGKVIHGITSAANKHGVPVVVIAGSVGEGVEKVYDLGVKAILTLPDRPMTLEEAMEQSVPLLRHTVHNLCGLLSLPK